MTPGGARMSKSSEILREELGIRRFEGEIERLREQLSELYNIINLMLKEQGKAPLYRQPQKVLRDAKDDNRQGSCGATSERPENE